MKKPFSRLHFMFLVVAAIPVLFACNPDKAPEKVEDEKKSEPILPKVFSGNYSYLSCTRTEFLALPEKSPLDGSKGKGLVMFKPNITDSGITLHGWSFKINGSSGFSDEPNVKLRVYKDTTLTYQTGSYIGGLIISRKDVKDIRQLLNSNTNLKTVFFQPFYTSASKTEVAYNIILTTGSDISFVNKDDKNVYSGKIIRPIPPGGGQFFGE